MSDLLTPAGAVTPYSPRNPDGIVLAFKVNRALLERALTRIAPVVSSKDVQPVLRNFHFRLHDGDLRITGSDSTLSALAHIPVTDSTAAYVVEGTALFPATRLAHVVGEAADDDLLISVRSKSGNLIAHIHSGKARWQFPLMSAEQGFPEFAEAEQASLTPIPREPFLTALNQVRKAASTDVMRPYLMLVDVSRGRLRASDSVRFQQVTFDFPFDCQIPIRAVREILTRLTQSTAEEIGVGQTDRALLFKFGRVLLICQKVNVNFPDVDEVLLKPALDNDQAFTVSRDDLLQAVRRMRITADEDTAAVVLSLNTNSVSIECKDRRGGFAVESIDAEWDRSPRHLSFNHQHLTDLLSSAQADQCLFRLGKDLKTKPTPLVLDDPENGFTAVLSQIRLDWL